MACQLTVLDIDTAIQWNLDDWTVWSLLASLSAEPESIEELLHAVERYLPDHRLRDTGRGNESGRGNIDFRGTASTKQPWCLIDLVGHTMIAGNNFEYPNPDGAYQADENDHAEGLGIVWLDVPTDWLWQDATEQWQDNVQQRRELPTDARVDCRRILFGQPLISYLAERTLKSATETANRDQKRRFDLTRQIHADWLITDRDDLGHRTPRQFLLASRDRIQRDLEHRSRQWSKQRYAPPAIPKEWPAYRYGGFGTTEIVLYFDLVRALLAAAWDHLERFPATNKGAMIEHLTSVRDGWLTSPYDDGSGGEMTCAELIESERRRMPVTDDRSHLDCDCPICQAKADGAFGSGPAFLWFDGHHLELEDEFAFSMTESHTEWEQDQKDCGFCSEDFDDDFTEHEAAEESRADTTAWQATYVDWDVVTATDAPVEFAKSAVGFPLAEIVSELKKDNGNQARVESLNQTYADFRRASDTIAERSAANALREQLEAVAQAFPTLVSRSADLQSHLDEVSRKLG